MRITNQMLSNQMLSNINRNLGMLSKYNVQGSSGKKIQVPSDDPIVASRALKFRTMLSETEQYSKNANDAGSWIDVTETVYTNMNKILVNMKGVLSQMSSDTYTTEDREKMMTEYTSLMEQYEQELNTDYMGRNIFSGFKTNEKPIIKDANGKNILNEQIFGKPAEVGPPLVPGIPPVTGGEFDVNGDGVIDPDTEVFKPQYIEVQVGGGTTIGVNTLSPNLYNQDDYNELRGGIFETGVTFPLTTPAGNGYVGTTQFERISNFVKSDEYKAMSKKEKLEWENEVDVNDNKVNDIRAMASSMLTTLENFQSKLSTQETDTGVKSERVDLIQERLQDDKLNFKTLLSKNEDVDVAEVMMNYNTANAAYTASLNLGMKITQLTLADYLR